MQKKLTYGCTPRNHIFVKHSPVRVSAILQMPIPTDQAVLILAKDVAWHWDEAQQNAFSKLKLLFRQVPILKYYDVSKELTL